MKQVLALVTCVTGLIETMLAYTMRPERPMDPAWLARLIEVDLGDISGHRGHLVKCD